MYNLFMKNPLLRCFLLLLGIGACQLETNREPSVKPENIESTDEGKRLEDSLKKEYRAQLYFAAPGTNVDSIRHENWLRNMELKQARRTEAASRSVTEIFAGGLIEATWHERGPTNEAGDMRVIDFDPATEDFYAISTVGHLWKGNLNGNTWNLLNDDIRFEPDEIAVLPHNGAQRLFAIYGTGVDDKKIRYSDNQGQTWTTGTGFTFYDHWGKGRRLYPLSDQQTLYYLVHTWQNSPWGEVIQLYKTTDKGVSYTKVWNSPVGYTLKDVDLWKPHGSDQMYMVDNRAQNYYQVTHNFGNGVTTISAPVNYSNQNVTTGGMHLSGRWNSTANAYELFMIHDANQNVYKTTNGSAWTFLSTCPENVWTKGWLADPDNQNLYVGGFQLNKTANGTTWKEQYVQWWEYYKNTPTRKDSMHVDIMNLEYFKKSNGTPFIIALNHAGIHVTYNNFNSTTNLGLNDLNVVTLYDQTTASDGFLYCGAQDKGNFKHGNNSLANFNPLQTDNMSTGDGMLGVFFNSDQSFYAMIQNGTLMCFRNRNSANYSSFTIPGTHKPGWINPIVPTPNFTDNKAYMAGGNLNGGAGSYLITANVNISGGGVVWQNSQFNYDFRANSNNGTSVIKAIGVSESDHNRLYVSTQDATFFYSTNQGTSWTKSVAANLPTTMIPWDIKCAKNNPNKVFVCGTGFSNSGVFQSNDGGVTFSALNSGIPAATFYEVSLSNNEEFLFAATSNGPYVYVFDNAQWYSLLGADTPILDFNTVDIVSNTVVRFGTYGRGVWDFQITNAALPVELTAFTARPFESSKTQLDWATASEYNVATYAIEYSRSGHDYQTIGTVPAKGNGNNLTNYQWLHPAPQTGDNYYRLRILDRDGSFAYSPMQVVRFEHVAAPFVLFPSVVAQQGEFSVQPNHEEAYDFLVYSMEGRLVHQQRASGPLQVQADWPSGTYVYQMRAGQRQVSGRLMVQ
jgi:hypothetical protein